MANYTIQRSLLAAGDITVTEASVNTDTNVSLVGQNFTGYGDEIATNFLQMLENFAADTAPNLNPRVPGSSAITGQLWYDTANAVLKVYNGTSWVEQAKTNTASTESATLRWNNTNKRWQPEERVRVGDSGQFYLSVDGALTNAVTAQHDGTDLNFSFAGTTDFNISGLTGEVIADSGAGFRSTLGAGSITMSHDGTNANFTTTSTQNINLPATVTLKTTASTTTRAGINIAEGVAPSSPVDGDLWVTAAGELWAYLDGSPVELSAVSGGTVTSTGSPADNQIAVWTAVADQLEGTAGLTYNGTTLAVTGGVTATSFGGITSANLIDRTAPGTISGAPTLTAATTALTATLGDIRVQGGFGYVTSDGSTSIGIRAESGGNTIDFTHANSPYWDIQGLTSARFGAPVYTTSAGSEAMRVVGDAATWSTADSYISFYDSDMSEHGLQIGTTTGDGSAARINARLGQLNLYASNTQVVNFQTSLITFTSGGVTSLSLRNSFTSNNTTSAAVTDNNGNLRNVGYNETPVADDVGANINTGSFTLSNVSIGKFISRTTSTSRSLTLGVDANIPIGASVLVHNGSSGGTFTIITSGTTLYWIDGSGSTVTGNRTLANNSVATIRKATSTTWQIWGNGLS